MVCSVYVQQNKTRRRQIKTKQNKTKQRQDRYEVVCYFFIMLGEKDEYYNLGDMIAIKVMSIEECS